MYWHTQFLKLIVEVTVDLMLHSNRSHGSLYTTIEQTSSVGTGI